MKNNPVSSNKIYSYIFLPVFLALTFSAIVNIQLFQDGGSYLFEILQMKSAAIRHHRISVALIQLPTILLIKFLGKFFGGVNDHLSIIRIIFSLSYSMVPFLSLLLSWLVVRKRNEDLFIWAALIILFVNLVNFSGVSELLMSLQLSCPLMLASILIPRTRFFWVLMGILLPFIFFLHPLVVILFITMAVGIMYAGYKKPEKKTASRQIAIILVAVAILKLILNIYSLSTYETSFLETKGMNEYILDTSIENKIFLFVSLLIGTGILIGKYQFKFKRIASTFISIQRAYFFLILLAVVAGFLLVFQYSYREFPLKTGLSMLASLTILLMMAFDSAEKTTAIEMIHRFRLTTVLAIVFSLVIVSKALIWQSSIHKLRQSISKSEGACLELNTENFKWLNTNPYKIINTWALPSLALIEQDIQPRKLLLEKGSCKIYRDSSLVKFDEWTLMPKKYITPSIQ
jgi:hypothetical protein